MASKYLNASCCIDSINSCTGTDSLEDSEALIVGLLHASKLTTSQKVLKKKILMTPQNQTMPQSKQISKVT